MRKFDIEDFTPPRFPMLSNQGLPFLTILVILKTWIRDRFPEMFLNELVNFLVLFKLSNPDNDLLHFLRRELSVSMLLLQVLDLVALSKIL